MIPKIVVDAARDVVEDRTLYVDVKLTRKDGFSLQAEFTLVPGITMLLGPSGAGKTTLLDSIAGLTRPDRGRIVTGKRGLFDDEQHIDVSAHQRHCGYLFQDLALFPHMTARENIEYGLAGRKDSERVAWANDAMQAFR